MRRIDRSATITDQAMVKHSLLRIVCVRFRAFEAKFGRLPKRDEPIFFDESHHQPVKASMVDARSQLERGAKQAGVSVDPVLQFLGFSPQKIRTGERLPSKASSRSVGSLSHRLPRHPGSTYRQTSASTGWNRFLADGRVLRRHRVTRQELQALSSTAFLGEVRTERTLLSVLNLIRNSGARVDKEKQSASDKSG